MTIHVEDLVKNYHRGGTVTPVLRGVHLEVAGGECVFLAGPSGSGKTTLLSILGCILTPDRGTVRILDRDLSTLGPRQRRLLRRDRIGFVFQKFHLVRGLSALDNVTVPLKLQRVRPRQAAQRAVAALESVGLGDKLQATPKNMSVGECQRVALARALVTRPEIILADEPTASLDARSGQEVMKLLIQQTTQQGKSLLVVTHDPRIFQYADRICHMENGTLAEHPQTLAS